MAERTKTVELHRDLVKFCRGKKTAKQAAEEFKLTPRTATAHLEALVTDGKLTRWWDYDSTTTVPVGRYVYKRP